MALISVSEALNRLRDSRSLVGVERVPLAQAHGRVLAEDLGAKLTQPPFDASAMDGYAVRAADVRALPATLALVGESAAGARYDGILEPGQAVRIFTGAPVPDGADTIVIQEDTEALGTSVLIKEAEAGRHIRPRGQDFLEGDVLLKMGKRLGARSVMLAASMNYANVLVRRKPKVAILSTGDEVVPPGSELGPDQIAASAGYGIAAFVEANGGIAIDLGIAGDDAAALAEAIARAEGADILVTIGGASVGDRDLMQEVLGQAGMQLDFAKVAVRPGKPVFAGRLGEMRVLGLPGNPVSALVCAVVFLRPILAARLGSFEGIDPQCAVLECPLPENGERESYLRAISTLANDGTRTARPVPSQDSSLVAALAESDCLIQRPRNAPPLPEGAKVIIWRLLD
jgi:molybdopterin molybdotransferase